MLKSFKCGSQIIYELLFQASASRVQVPATIDKFSFFWLRGILSRPKSVAQWQQTWKQKARETAGKLIALKGKSAVRANGACRIWIACSIIVNKESWHQRLISKHWYGALREDAFFRLRVSNVAWNQFQTDIIAAVLRGRDTVARPLCDADYSKWCVCRRRFQPVKLEVVGPFPLTTWRIGTESTTPCTAKITTQSQYFGGACGVLCPLSPHRPHLWAVSDLFNTAGLNFNLAGGGSVLQVAVKGGLKCFWN